MFRMVAEVTGGPEAYAPERGCTTEELDVNDAVIIDAVRTPLGRRNGKLAGWHPVDLAAHTLRALVDRNDLDPGVIDDVVMGVVMQVGEQTLCTGRNAVLAAGFPDHVPGTSIDRQCGSSQQAIHFAAQGVMAGAYDVVIAAGVESMTRVPMGSSLVAGQSPFGPKMHERYPNLVPQGISAELIAEKWGLAREELDAFALESHRRAAQATDEGRFEHQIVPVPVTTDDGSEVMTRDEGIRPDTSLERLAALKPSFQPDGGVITAGNSSQITDGAAAVLITSEDAAVRLGLTPRRAIPHVRARGKRPDPHAHRADSGDGEGARTQPPHSRRHGSDRDQRSVRVGRARVGARRCTPT